MTLKNLLYSGLAALTFTALACEDLSENARIQDDILECQRYTAGMDLPDFECGEYGWEYNVPGHPKYEARENAMFPTDWGERILEAELEKSKQDRQDHISWCRGDRAERESEIYENCYDVFKRDDRRIAELNSLAVCDEDICNTRTSCEDIRYPVWYAREN